MTGETLELTIRIAARPETVYRFLVDPERFKLWMGGSALLDNGRLEIRYPSGDTALGEILETVPGKRVVYSYGYANNVNGMPPGSTRLTIELSPYAGGTEVTLLHEGLPDEAQRDGHRMGWKHYAAKLAASVTARELAALLPDLLERYQSVWNETDRTRRMRLIHSVWEENAVYRDAMSYASGWNDLDGLIAGAQMTAPGLRLEVDAATASECQGSIGFKWQTRLPSGQVFATGTCFGTVTGEGKLREVTGFFDRR
ncbi:MAG: SRPBCC domain-containing protein [Bryobacteraceae bacterium]